jgi:UDP-glucuronate decarboxylase
LSDFKKDFLSNIFSGLKKNSRILLTGGTGFFGRSILRFCKEQDSSGLNVPQILVVSRNPDSFLVKYPEFGELNWLSFFKCDVEDAESVLNIPHCDFVLHAAANSTSLKNFSEIDRRDQIINGTKNILNFVVKYKIKKLLYISSGAVYGNSNFKKPFINETLLREYDSLDNTEIYGKAKLEAEHLCILYGNHYNFKITIARCFAFAGRDLPLNEHFAIGNFVYDAIFSENIILKSSGNSVRSYLSQDDLAKWLFVLLIHGKNKNIYNVGSDKPISIYDLAFMVRNLISPSKKIQICNKNTSAADSIYVPSINKVRNEYNLDVWTTVEDIIISMANGRNAKLLI